MNKDEAVILTLRDVANEHKKLSELYSKAADDLESGSTDLTNIIENLSSKNMDVVKKIIQSKRRNLTFQKIIVKIFKDAVPRSSRHLLSEFNIVSGKQLMHKTFVSQLILLKKKDVIRMHKFPERHPEFRFIYGLSEWFDDGELKNEFLVEYEDKKHKDELQESVFPAI
jgi:hypothetical protein